MFAGKTQAEIKSELVKLKKRQEAHKEKTGKADPKISTKIKQHDFALRAKHDFGKVNESIDHDSYEVECFDWKEQKELSEFKRKARSEGKHLYDISDTGNDAYVVIASKNKLSIKDIKEIKQEIGLIDESIAKLIVQKMMFMLVEANKLLWMKQLVRIFALLQKL